MKISFIKIIAVVLGVFLFKIFFMDQWTQQNNQEIYTEKDLVKKSRLPSSK